MIADNFVDNAKIMAEGQVTIPKIVRNVLGVSSGDSVTFVVENGSVRVINSAVYAMQSLQEKMKGEGKKSGLNSEEKISDLVKEIRTQNPAK